MHQSLMFSIQCSYVRANRSGTKRMRPSRTAASAGSAIGAIRTNHCSEISGSMTVWQRWQCPTACGRTSVFTRKPPASRSRTLAQRASSRSIPA